MASAELTCRQLVEQVTDLLEGRLDPRERLRIAGHLARCAGCRRYLAQHRAVRATLARDGVARAVSPVTRARLAAAFRAWWRARP